EILDQLIEGFFVQGVPEESKDWEYGL
ncbi:hypothetical protein Tco_1171833, partial [Tanacetum coccineum]